MTSTGLPEIMHEVPREAWPQNTEGLFALPRAEEACIGSMLNYLLGEGYHSLEFELCDHSVRLRIYGHTFEEPLERSVHVQIHTRLLATACREVEQEESK